MDLSPDFYYSSHDANGWQLNQSIQRAVSSDAISSASCRVEGTPLENHTYGAPLRNRTFSGGVVNNLSHSHSMILPTQRIPATGKCDLRMMLEAPSPESEVHTPKPGSSRPESSVDLRGAQLQWAAELSSKRNVFKLRTVTGNEFLLQSDSDALIRDWYRSIQNIIHRLDEENPLDNVLLFSLRRAGSVELLDHSGDEDEERGEVKEASLPRSRSNLEHAEQKRVKSRLKKLILRRPPLQALHEKGLIKDQVFGCALELLCEREKSSVPQFVRRCTEAVERRGQSITPSPEAVSVMMKGFPRARRTPITSPGLSFRGTGFLLRCWRGLESDGIYRVSGNLAVVQKLRFAVNHGHGSCILSCMLPGLLPSLRRAMLSGGWRRGTLTPAGSKNLPNTAPVILEVQYDYSYRGTDGRTVSMQEGERFLLIKKTNADWWQARRLGAEARAKPVYVPASYVLELPVSISRGPAADGGGGACERLRRTQAQGAANEALFCRSMENLSSRASTEKPSAAEPFLTPPLSGSGPASESGPGSAHLLNPGAFLSPGLVPIVRSQSSSNLPQNIHHEENPRCRANTHSQFSSLDYKSQSAIGHRWAEPPFPSPWQQPLQTLQHWEQFCDPITGRCYYVNAVTRERSWKPPRRSRENGAGKQERAVSTDGRFLFPEALVQEHLDLDAPQWEDIHVISGALKLFFRELPNPLIPFNMYHSVIRSVQLCDHQERLERLKLLVSSLPACNRDTLRHMIQHLRRPENDSGNIAINMVYQNQAIEILLSDYQQIFEHEPIRGMLTTPTN
ncbi:hypothetical protein DNTS_032898 [Danionella cerebrum]|uniref:Rho GTPase-activating protein 9 n=1 Tax=Danionella cerebrum TaxID=2873325 RepID=A0A553R5B8_9TELE|nr:hypothetical protein DNTS_032898 [Danionella translucida]